MSIFSAMNTHHINENTTIIEWVKHIGSESFTTYKTRDFHSVLIDIYNNLPDEDKIETHIASFNKMIITWHHQAPELWTSSVGIWSTLTNYLAMHFDSGDSKYSSIVRIFNDA